MLYSMFAHLLPLPRYHLTKSKHNTPYIRYLSDLKFKNHLRNRHVSLSIDTSDISIRKSHAC